MFSDYFHPDLIRPITLILDGHPDARPNRSYRLREADSPGMAEATSGSASVFVASKSDYRHRPPNSNFASRLHFKPIARAMIRHLT